MRKGNELQGAGEAKAGVIGILTRRGPEKSRRMT